MSSATIPPNAILVSGLSPTTTEKEVVDFFVFCGHVDKVIFDSPNATIIFDKKSSVQTAKMLEGGTLNGATLHVKAADDAAGEDHDDTDTEGVNQSDKPRTAIVAEYVAHGYEIGEVVIKRAIEFDQKQGISPRFLNFFNNINTSVGSKVFGEHHTVTSKLNETLGGVSNRARSFDQQRGLTDQFTKYIQAVGSTAVGEKVKVYYSSGATTLADVNEEALRIKAYKKQQADQAAGTVPPPSAASDAPAPASEGTAPIAPVV